MPNFPLDHLDGCTPEKPCFSCEAVSLLRSKMTESDLEEFFHLARLVYEQGAGNVSRVKRIVGARTIKDLELSMRAKNCLFGLSLEDLCRKTEDDLLIMPNLGRRTLQEVKDALTKNGLHLGMLD